MVRLIVDRTNQKIEEDFIEKAYSAETLQKSPHIAHIDEVRILNLFNVTFQVPLSLLLAFFKDFFLLIFMIFFNDCNIFYDFFT
jgi:hypothetical protein